MGKLNDLFDKFIEDTAKAKVNTMRKFDSGYGEDELADLEAKDFKDNLESIPVYPQMVKDLQKKAVNDYVGYLIRYSIVLLLSAVFMIMFFVCKSLALKGMFLLGAIYTIGICTMGDIVISYPKSNIKWYKDGIDGCYLAVVTYKHRLANNEKNCIVLNDMYSIMPSIVSEYTELDEGEAVLLVTRGNEYHMVSTEEFLGIEAKKQSLKEYLAASIK